MTPRNRTEKDRFSLLKMHIGQEKDYPTEDDNALREACYRYNKKFKRHYKTKRMYSIKKGVFIRVFREQ